MFMFVESLLFSIQCSRSSNDASTAFMLLEIFMFRVNLRGIIHVQCSRLLWNHSCPLLMLIVASRFFDKIQDLIHVRSSLSTLKSRLQMQQNRRESLQKYQLMDFTVQ